MAEATFLVAFQHQERNQAVSAALGALFQLNNQIAAAFVLVSFRHQQRNSAVSAEVVADAASVAAVAFSRLLSLHQLRGPLSDGQCC